MTKKIKVILTCFKQTSYEDWEIVTVPAMKTEVYTRGE